MTNNKEINKANNVVFKIIEKTLFVLFILIFCVLILIQSIRNMSYNEIFNIYDTDNDGIPLESEAYLFNKGLLILQLEDEESNQNIKILVNGNKTTFFYKRTLEVIVKKSDIIEINGVLNDHLTTIQVLNINQNNTLITIDVNDKIKKIGKIKETIDSKNLFFSCDLEW